jgi:hypothetical protein
MIQTMIRRALASLGVVALTVTVLAGCAATANGNPARTAAEADTTQWIRDAASAISPTPASEVKSSGYENCRTDHGYFVTKSEWRTVAQLTVPMADQAAATKAIATSFTAKGWSPKTTAGILTLTGPKGDRGQIRVETGGATDLDVAALSACYS